MSDPIIHINNVGKSYKLKHLLGTSKDDMFIHSLKNWTKNLFSRSQADEEFWALQNISFDIQKGDRVGIIGRNGAGKSTLLKILSRIVAPTTGRIEYDGRMASLLEVGTGFHGDLSGRENIYLNGSILGMSRKEINARFDEIVAFSEVEKFLDTPVKRYSSGMYVRLAFAVAAHLDPEILIVDEVLAVGDAAFQKKCLGKMREISGQGKTILFVSHNMAAIQNLCNKSLVLKNGQVDFSINDTNQAIRHFIKESIVLGKTQLRKRTDREGELQIKFDGICLVDKNGVEVNGIKSGEEINFVIETKVEAKKINNVGIAITIYSDEGIEMMTLANHIADKPFETVSEDNKLFCNIKKFPLTKGDYVANLSMYKDGILQDYIKEGFSFTVYEGDFYGSGKILPGHKPSVLIDHQWKIK
ncbi:MAG: ABC transporter ATP-binding protein [Bacteroidota bacterium]|nr:ABC transporter ATP-binding protein [Bacteroidota bacterium]